MVYCMNNEGRERFEGYDLTFALLEKGELRTYRTYYVLHACLLCFRYLLDKHQGFFNPPFFFLAAKFLSSSGRTLRAANACLIMGDLLGFGQLSARSLLQVNKRACT